MEGRTVSISLILLAVVLLTITQLIVKSRLSVHGAIPLNAGEFTAYILLLLRDIRLWLALVILIVGALGWYAAVSRLPLSVAFPFAALSYPLIYLGAILFLGEPLSWPLVTGNAFIVAGVLIVSISSGTAV